MIGPSDKLYATFIETGSIRYSTNDKKDKPWYFMNANGRRVYGPARGE